MLALFIIVSMASLNVYCQQKYINYGVDRQGVQLFYFFHDINNGFYVDIGAYDPIFASNTLNLQTRGWQGINIDASPKRLPRFFYSRPWQPSINYAIGDEDTYVVLYELSEDSSSTISPKVKDFVKGYKGVVEETRVPSISMKKLCERFFYRRPLFLNLDIQGYGSAALQSNDWKNPNCRPQVIFSQINDQTKITGLPLPQVVLAEHGYKKWKSSVGLNQIFVQQSLYSKYQQKYNQGVKLLSTSNIMNIAFVAYNFIVPRLKQQTVIVPHYEPLNDSVYYHFAKYKQSVDVHYLNHYSNLISSKKNRPIIVMNHNPEDAFIILRDQNYLCQIVNVSDTNFYNLTVFKQDGTNFSVIIMDHNYQHGIKPKVVITNIPQSDHQLNIALPAPKQPQPSYPQNSTQAIILSKIYSILNQSISISNKTSQNQWNRNRQLMSTLTTNHFYDKTKLQSVYNQLQVLQKVQNQIKNKLTGDQLQEIQDISDETQVLLKYQVFMLFTVFFALLVVNVLVCVMGAPEESYKKLKNPGSSSKEMSQSQIQNQGDKKSLQD